MSHYTFTFSRHSGHMIVEGVRPLSNIPCRQCLQ